MEEIIKKLEEEKKRLQEEVDLKIIKINSAIRILVDFEEYPKKMYEELAEKKVDHIRKKPKRKYVKKAAKPDLRRKIPEEMLDFVKKNMNLNNKDLVKEVNEKYGLEWNDNRMSVYLSQNKLRRKGKSYSKYPEEMFEFIKQNMEEIANPDLTEAVNKKFGLEMKIQNLKDYMQTHKLKRVNRIRSPKKNKEEKKN